MSLISTTIQADEWECGCWQIEGHSVLHLCSRHQNGLLPDDYWRTHPTVKKTLQLLEVSTPEGSPR